MRAASKVRLATADFAAEYAHFRSYGYTRTQIAERLGMTYDAACLAYMRAVKAGMLTPDRRPT